MENRTFSQIVDEIQEDLKEAQSILSEMKETNERFTKLYDEFLKRHESKGDNN